MRYKLAIISISISILMLSSVPEMANAQVKAQSGKTVVSPVLATVGTDWTLTVEPDATVKIYHKSAPVIESRYLFWGAKWSYVHAGFRIKSRTSDSILVACQLPGLKTDATGMIRSRSPNTLEFDFLFKASENLSPVIGGGIQWTFKLDSPSFGGRMPNTQLLDDVTGWRWPVGDGQFITLRSDQPLAKVYFERDQKDLIRTFVYWERVPAGPHRVHLTLTLPEGAKRIPSTEERYGEPDTSHWFRDAMVWNAAPVDLRFLNREDRPAGRRGFVKADGDRLVFADGTPARFWAAALVAGALFSTPRATIAPQARRMAQLGYNLIRVHHHDAGWLNPNIFSKAHNDTRHLDPKSLDALDWWIKCLKDEGIYIWLDLRASRRLKPEDRFTLGRDEIMKHGGEFEGYHYFNPELDQLMVEFQHAFLNHVNRYTGLAYKDDPAVVFVLVTNEDDLTGRFGTRALPDKQNPEHNAIFNRLYQAFAREHQLPPNRVFQTWLPGPSKLFLNEKEHQFNESMIADLRALGVKAPIATTNYYFGTGGLYQLPALADGDVIDVHSYGLCEALSTNPRYVANYVTFMSAAQVHGKPMTISEWNVLNDGKTPVAIPQIDRFTAPMHVASVAALQGWDMVMLYCYSQAVLQPPGAQDSWGTSYDPALTGVMPAAALAYRQGHISPARTSYCLALSPDAFFNRVVNADTSATIRTLSEQSKLTIGLPATKELPWLKPSRPSQDVTVVSDPDHDYIPPGQSFVQSDTGELTRDWESGIHTIDSPRTQSVSGWIGGKTLETHDATFRFTTNKAVVILSSVDNQPLATSRFILISAMARVVAAGPQRRLPFLSEPVTGTIALKTKTDGLQLLALGRDGGVVSRSTPSRNGDTLTIALPAGRGTHWFVLKTDGPSKETDRAEGRSGD
jgi:hypothetical protein